MRDTAFSPSATPCFYTDQRRGLHGIDGPAQYRPQAGGQSAPGGCRHPGAAAGAGDAFLRIRAQVDPNACFHQLTALAGAEAGIPKKALSQEEKAALRSFFDNL